MLGEARVLRSSAGGVLGGRRWLWERHYGMGKLGRGGGLRWVWERHYGIGKRATGSFWEGFLNPRVRLRAYHLHLVHAHITGMCTKLGAGANHRFV